jgi:hypothetical protein
MTTAQIFCRYTKVKKFGDKWHVWLRVDQQSFRLEYSADTRAEANWCREQLAIALQRMIEGGGKV